MWLPLGPTQMQREVGTKPCKGSTSQGAGRPPLAPTGLGAVPEQVHLESGRIAASEK